MDFVVRNEERSDMDKLLELIKSLPPAAIEYMINFAEGVRWYTQNQKTA